MASNVYKRLLSQTAIYGTSSILARFLNYLLVFLYTRVFLPEEYGIVNELYAYAGLLMIVLTYGMETGFFKFVQSENNVMKVYGTTLSSLLMTSVVFIGSAVWFAQPIAGLIGYGNNSEYVIWFAIILGVDAISSIPFVYLRQQNKAMKFMMLRLSNIVLQIVINLFFLLLCKWQFDADKQSFFGQLYSPKIGVGYIFIANLAASLLNMLFFIPEFFKIKLIPDRKLLGKMLVYSLPLLVVGLAGMVNQSLDRILQKYFLVAPENVTDSATWVLSQIGIYGANFKIAVLITLFVQTFRYAAEPFFFNQAKTEDSKKSFANILKYFVIFCLSIFLVIMLYIDVVKHFIGVNYHSGLKVVPILLMGNVFMAVVVYLSMWYKITGKTAYGIWITLLGAVITIAVNVIFLPHFGYIVSAWANLLCYTVMMVFSYLLGQKFYPVNYPLKRLGLYFLLSVGFYAISTLVYTKFILINLLIGSFMLLIYFFTIYKMEHLKPHLMKIKEKLMRKK